MEGSWRQSSVTTVTLLKKERTRKEKLFCRIVLHSFILHYTHTHMLGKMVKGYTAHQIF